MTSSTIFPLPSPCCCHLFPHCHATLLLSCPRFPSPSSCPTIVAIVGFVIIIIVERKFCLSASFIGFYCSWPIHCQPPWQSRLLTIHTPSFCCRCHQQHEGWSLVPHSWKHSTEQNFATYFMLLILKKTSHLPASYHASSPPAGTATTSVSLLLGQKVTAVNGGFGLSK